MSNYTITNPTRDFKMLSYEKFRDTPDVKFFDITVNDSNARDLVIHSGPAISPPNDENNCWQFYLHRYQEDNLLALKGGRTFYLVNFSWNHPFHIVRLELGTILKIPIGTFHRSVSDPDGSIVLNQAIRTNKFDVKNEFSIYSSGRIPLLMQATEQNAPLPKLHGLNW